MKIENGGRYSKVVVCSVFIVYVIDYRFYCISDFDAILLLCLRVIRRTKNLSFNNRINHKRSTEETYIPKYSNKTFWGLEIDANVNYFQEN